MKHMLYSIVLFFEEYNRKQRKYRTNIEKLISHRLDVNAQKAQEIYHQASVSRIKFKLQYLMYSIFGSGYVSRRIDKSRIEGQNNLEAVLSSESPILVISVHMGDFYTGFLKLSKFVSTNRSIKILKANKGSRKEDSIIRKLSTSCPNISVLRLKKNVAKDIYKELKNKNIICMMIDIEISVQTRSLVHFRGNPYLLQDGPAHLAVVTGATILPLVTFTNDKGELITRLESPIYPDVTKSKTRETKVAEVMGSISETLEKWVSGAPGQLHYWFDFAQTLTHQSTKIESHNK